MAYLKFSVNHQIISRIDEFKPVSDSKNYLTAGFVFETDEWEGKIVTAIFRNDEQAFEVILDSNNECLVPWELIDDGQNEIFVSCFAGDLITVNKARVRIYESGYSDDLESETPPTPSVYGQIVTRLGRVENLDVLAKTLPAGSAATVEKKIQYMTGGYLFEFGIPNGMPGEDGEDGQDGQDGYSPTVSITDIPGGSNITITDKNGVHSCNILNGTPGSDGFSPIISSGSISGGHRVIIQDKYTTQSFDVMDGEDYVLTEQDKQEIADMVEVPGTTFYICTSSEYDPVTRVPTVQNPSEDVFYLVPAESGTSTDMFVEWIYSNNHWEMFGSASIDLTNYVQKSDIDVGLSSTSENPVQNKVVKAAIDGKVDKETGKGLSSNDFTSAEKNKLAGIATGAEVNVQSDWNQTNTSADDFIKNKPTIPAPVTVDSAMSTTSENPVQNKIINSALSDVIDELNHKVSDVKINGTSIVTDGVAEIPTASNASLGVLKVNGNGLQMFSSKEIAILKPTDAQVKAGSENYRPITPFQQHASAFYGLAKAASDTTQSASSNPVGTYTDDAKVKIQKMLGIYEAPWELIREDTVTNATEADIDITVDGNGNPFELKDVLLQFETPIQDTASAKTGSGTIMLYHGVGSSNRFNAETGGWTQAAGGAAHGAFVSFTQDGNLILMGVKVVSTGGNNGNYAYRFSSAEKSAGIYYNSTGADINIIRVVIPGVFGTMHYRLFGKRKWS